MQDLIEILQQLGYPITSKTGDYITSQAIYRGGDNPGAICIYPKIGKVIDFPKNEKFSITELIRRTIGADSEEKAVEWLKTKEVVLEKKEFIEKIKMPHFLSNDIISFIKPDYEFYEKQGISIEVLKKFRSGLCLEGKMKNRYCFPIFDSKDRVIGITGRDITNKHSIKWKHFVGAGNGGGKSFWIWPAFLNNAEIKEKKQVILVESPHCVIRLFNAGVTNVLCLFGLEMSLPILNYLIKHRITDIVIALNNEDSSRGNDAGLKLYRRLSKYFDKRNLRIVLPPDGKKDFGAVLEKEKIENWAKKNL